VSTSPTGSEALVWQAADQSPTGSERLGILGVGDGSVRWLTLPGQGEGRRVYWVSWAISVPTLAAEVGDARARTVLRLDVSRPESSFLPIHTYTSQGARLSHKSILAPVPSPDGKRILFLLPADGSTEVCIASAGGGRVRKIASLAGSPTTALAAWAPDGRTVYVGAKDTTAHDPARHVIYALRGLKNPERLCGFHSNVGTAAMSVQPSGEWILLVFYQRPPKGALRRVFWLVKADGSEMEEMPPVSTGPVGLPCEAGISIPRWHPDGNRLLYHDSELDEPSRDVLWIKHFSESLVEGVGEYRRADWLLGTPFLLAQDPPDKGGSLKTVNVTGEVVGTFPYHPSWDE
jgi:hypothetical protein